MIPLTALLALLALLALALAFPPQDFFVREGGELAPAGVAGAGPRLDPPVQASAPPVDYALLATLLSSLPPQRRTALLSQPQAFRAFVQRELDHRAILQAALDAGMSQQPRPVFLIRRSAQGTLRDYYVDQEIRSRIASDFPNDEQMREYYQHNRARYTLPRRVHVWQVFIPVADDATAVAQARERAQQLEAALRAGKQSFDEAVGQHSRHASSRLRGGYLGLLSVAEMGAEFRDVVLALPENGISQPVRGKEGFHILRRGAFVPERELSFEEVRRHVREKMRNDLHQRLRQQIYREAHQAYPYPLSEKEIERWRLRLAGSDSMAGQG